MSNTKKATVQQGPSITTNGTRKITAKDKSPFTIDDTVYHLIKPKAAMLGQAAAVLDSSRPWDAGESGRVLLQYAATLIPYIEYTPPKPDGTLTGRAHLAARLDDPMDDLDLEHLVPLFTDIMSEWFSRPTGSPRASAQRPAASRAGASRASTR